MDVWTKHGADGKTIVFRKDGDKDVGFVYSAQGRVTTETWGPTPEEYSKEQIEEHFADYLKGPKPATETVQPAGTVRIEKTDESGRAN